MWIQTCITAVAGRMLAIVSTGWQAPQPKVSVRRSNVPSARVQAPQVKVPARPPTRACSGKAVDLLLVGTVGEPASNAEGGLASS